MSTYGTIPDEKPSWQKLAEPLQLLAHAFVSVGKDILVLSVIIWKVYFREMYQLPCDTVSLGVPLAFACEFTKAHMRSLPLMGVVILIIVASRQILYERIYYQMLIHSTLLRFESQSPLNDPIFRLLLWTIANAFCHFAPLLQAFSWFYSEKYPDEQVVTEAKEVFMFYCLPMGIFTWLLWKSYNIHARLMPFSMYIDEDPAAARLAFAQLTVLDESIIVDAIDRGLMRSTGSLCSMKEAILEMKEQELELARPEFEPRTSSDSNTPRPHSRNNLQGALAGTYDLLKGNGTTLQWRLDSKLWPAKLLLSRRLQDEESIRFMHMWCNYILVASSMQLCVLVILICDIFDEFLDIPEGLTTHSVVVIVQAAILALATWLSFCFVRNAFISLRSSIHRVDLICCTRYNPDVTMVSVSLMTIPVAIGLFLIVVATRIIYTCCTTHPQV